MQGLQWRPCRPREKQGYPWQKENKAHVFKSCNKATLRYEDDVPLNARRGALVDMSPQGLQDTISWAHTTGPQRVYEPGGRSGTGTDTDSSESTDSD